MDTNYEQVQFTVLQPSRGSFRALMLWARANTGVMVARVGGLPRRAGELARLIQDGNPSNTALVDAALGKAQGASLLGGDVDALAARLNAFYAGLDQAGAANIKWLMEAINAFHEGHIDREEVLKTLVATLPAPPRLVHPRTLDEAWRLAEGVTLVMTLRRAVVRLIATQDGITGRLGGQAERQYEKQGVILLGQLELLCAVADDHLRTQAERDGDDPDMVSTGLVKAFAERARRLGYPIQVREAPLGAEALNEAWDVSREMPGHVGRFLHRLGDGLADMGLAGGKAGFSLGRLALALTHRLWGAVQPRLTPRVLLTLALLTVMLVLAVRPPTNDRRPPTADAGSSVSAVVSGPLSAVASPGQVRVMLRVNGLDSLDNIADYFGFRDSQAYSLFIWYNAAAVNSLKGQMPALALYTASLPKGIVLSIPTTRVAAGDLTKLAQDYGTTVEAIQRLNVGATATTLIIPVGRQAKLSDTELKTEPIDFRSDQSHITVGRIVE